MSVLESLLDFLLEFLTGRRVIVIGDSMSPTYREGQRLVVSRRAYRRRRPARFDVVLLAAPGEKGREDLKRVVGLPWEEVTLSDGVLLVAGARTEEPYLATAPDAPEGSFDWRTGQDEYVVLGDNRRRSTDSRAYGVVALRQIVGPVVR